MRRDFRTIGEVLKFSKEFQYIRELASSSEVIDIFFSCYPQYKNYVFAIKIEKKKLVIRIENSAIRSSIKHKTEEIISSINDKFTRIMVEEIELKV